MDYELIFWIVAGIAGAIATVVMYLKAKRESENYVEWVAE